MEFRILGPLEVETDGTQLGLGPTKQRALLALLLVHSNRVVSRDQLLDALWGERPPETAATALHGYVSGLRKALGKERIETRSGGYVLHADWEEVDLERFERLAVEARALEPRAAADQLRAALALWRGRPLADLDGAPFLESERRRLEETRLGTIEDRVDADLALSRQTELIAELDALVREHTLRERLRGQLMLALYRSGRQAEALEVYRQGRNLLAEELGLEPGEELKRLERGILEHDPALGPVAPPEAPAPTGQTPSGARPTRVRRLSRSRVAMIGAGALVLAVAATVIALTLSGGSSALPARANSVAVIDPKTNQLVDDVTVGTRPVAIAVGEGGVWVANADDRTVSRIDPKTRQVVNVIGVGTDPHDLAVGFGSVWVAEGTDGTVTRIDPKTNRVETLALGPRTEPSDQPLFSTGSSDQPVFFIAAGAGSVWATKGDFLLRIDPGTDKVVSRTEIFAEPTGLAADQAVWVTTDEEQLSKYSARDPSTASGSFGLGATGLAPTVGAGSVWVIVYSGRGVIQPFDAVALSLGPGTQTSAFPLDLAVGRGSVWAVDVRGTVLRINPATAGIVARIATAPTLRSAIAVGEGAVWVAIQGT